MLDVTSAIVALQCFPLGAVVGLALIPRELNVYTHFTFTSGKNVHSALLSLSLSLSLSISIDCSHNRLSPRSCSGVLLIERVYSFYLILDNSCMDLQLNKTHVCSAHHKKDIISSFNNSNSFNNNE